MKRLPALAGVLALLCIPSQAGATKYRVHREHGVEIHGTYAAASANAKVKVVLRHHVRKNRRVAWRWQDKAGLDRSPALHRERHASIPYLRRLVHLWWKRAHRAMHHYKTVRATPHYSTSTSSVDGCLSELISRESGWDVHAENPRSHAYGLPQALPGKKMASAGADWHDNPATQIRWMLGYVQKYGGSCGALAFQKANGWY